MKKIVHCILLLLSICMFMFITGCEKKEGLKEINTADDELFDIYYIKEAPRTNEKHSITEVIKVVFSMSDSSTGDTLAIDIEENEVYIDPWMSSLGVNTVEGTKKVEDAEKVLDVLKKYNVQEWKKDYTRENSSTYEDGFGWSLKLQFKNGMVEEHSGSGSEDEVTPENFEEFYEELSQFVDERLDEK